MDPSVTYARSTAISPEHYKLVSALENATSSGPAETILLQQIDSIKRRWNSSTTSSKSAAHDLILLLYALSQRPADTYEPADGSDPWGSEWAWAGAVKLAGGASKLSERAIGYRACDELLTEAPHALKLLLINSIRSDLYAPTGSPDAEQRWALGLRAAASARLGCAELAPAVADRVLELFARAPNPRMRRLALAALQGLIGLSPPDESDAPTSLANSTRAIILAALTPPPPPPLTSIRSHSDRSVSRHRPQPPAPAQSLAENDPGALLALVRACAPSSKLFPVAPAPQVVRLLCGVLRRLADGEWAGQRAREYHGLSGGWLSAGVLEGVREHLALPEGTAFDRSLRVEVVHAVLAYVATILDKVDLGQALLLPACQALATTPELLSPASLGSPYNATLKHLLSAIKGLLHGKDATKRLAAVRCLSALPAEVWGGTEEGEGAMGEREWEVIMRGLEGRDSNLRKETLRLLKHVDPALPTAHITRLFASLKALCAPPPPGSSAPPATKAAISAAALAYLEASAVVDSSATVWAQSVAKVVGAVGKPESVLGEVVMTTLDRFGLATPDEQSQFGVQLLQAAEWKNDLSLALLLAATAARGTSSLTTRRESALTMARWLANKDGASRQDMVEQLQEPFVLSIVRLLASFSEEEQEGGEVAEGEEEDNSPFSSQIQQPATSASQQARFLAQLDKLLETASRSGSLATAPLFELYTRCREEELAQRALREAGQDSKSETLPGFFDALRRRLRKAVPAAPSTRAIHRDRSSSVGSSSVGSPPPRAQRLEKPLRYEAYAGSPSRDDDRERERRRAQRAAERERVERGGRGGMAQSVLEEGALERLVIEQGIERGSSDEESVRASQARPGMREREYSQQSDGIPPADLLGPSSPTDPFAQH